MDTFDSLVDESVCALQREIINDPDLVFRDNCDVGQLASEEGVSLFEDDMMTPEFVIEAMIAHPEILTGNSRHCEIFRTAAASAFCMASIPRIEAQILQWGDDECIDLNTTSSPGVRR